MGSIVGTHIINEDGQLDILVCHRKMDFWYHRLSTFQAVFPPITRKLPVADDGEDIAILFYLFGMKGRRESLHVYIKSAIYAYQQLVRCTNILDCGKVRFFVDDRYESLAAPYFEVCGLQSLFVPVDIASKPQTLYGQYPYAGYVPYFEHESIKDCRHRIKFDADHWFMNVRGDETLDWKEVCAGLDAHNNCLFADNNYNPNRPIGRVFDTVLKDLNLYDHETEIEQFMENTFGKGYTYPPFPERFIRGTIVGVPKHSEVSEKLQRLYTEHGHLIPNDEAFLLTFMAMNLHIEAYDIGRVGGHISYHGLNNDANEFGLILMNIGIQAMDSEYGDLRKWLYPYIMEGLS